MSGPAGIEARLVETVSQQEAELERQRKLIVWLSLSYGDNAPIFAGADGEGTYDGVVLPEADVLRRTWEAATGRTSESVPGRWGCCPTCGSYSPTIAPTDLVPGQAAIDEFLKRQREIDDLRGEPEHEPARERWYYRGRCSGCGLYSIDANTAKG